MQNRFSTGYAQAAALDTLSSEALGPGPRSRVRVRGPGSWVDGSRASGPGSLVPGPRYQGPGSRVQGPASRVQGLGLFVAPCLLFLIFNMHTNTFHASLSGIHASFHWLKHSTLCCFTAISAQAFSQLPVYKDVLQDYCDVPLARLRMRCCDGKGWRCEQTDDAT